MVSEAEIFTGAARDYRAVRRQFRAAGTRFRERFSTEFSLAIEVHSGSFVPYPFSYSSCDDLSARVES